MTTKKSENPYYKRLDKYEEKKLKELKDAKKKK